MLCCYNYKFLFLCVKFGLLGLLVTRREGRSLSRYGHLSTGNYNPRTARLYTDISHLTADPQLTADMEHVFLHLASQSRLPPLKKLLLAPFHLHRKLIARINQLGEAAAAGIDTRIVLKMNALTDEALMLALVRAAQRGVQTDLIVRGACILPPQVAGLTDNIRVRSIIGRFLEHSRVFYFRQGADETVYLSSADLMNRNMLRRIEIVWPVADPALRQRVIDECLLAYLHDTHDAWDLSADGSYVRVRAGPGQSPAGAQDALMARYAARTSGN